MRNIAVVAYDSWQENLKNRFFLSAVVFGLVLLYVSLLLGVLAQDQEARALLDFGSAFIELFGLAMALYGAATTILREMETKTLYLILTRPVSRAQYLLGRFLGLMASVLAAMALMACFHLFLLVLKGWLWNWSYLTAFLGSFLKIFITAGLTLFLAVFSSSVLTALVIAAILWTLGHFLPEIRFLAGRAPGRAVLPLRALSYLIPDLGLFNWRDHIEPGGRPAVFLWLGYAAAYCGAWLSLAIALFSRKEL